MSYRALINISHRTNGFREAYLSYNFSDDFFTAERLMDGAAKSGSCTSHEAILEYLTREGAAIQEGFNMDEYEATYADQRWVLSLRKLGDRCIIRLSGRDADGEQIFFRKLERTL